MIVLVLIRNSNTVPQLASHALVILGEILVPRLPLPRNIAYSISARAPIDPSLN